MLHDHEADRELVQQTLSREWGESACAVHIRDFSPCFWVRGRQSDGSTSSRHRIRRYFRFLINTVVTIVALIADFIADSSSGIGVGGKTYRGRVRGCEGSPAVQFADAVGGGELWLVIGASRLGVAKTGSSPPVMVMWSAAGADCPQLYRDAGKLRWPDGSYVVFLFDTGESQRLVAV